MGDTLVMAHLPTASPRGRIARQRAIARSVDTLPTFADMRRNLLETIADADSVTECEGLGWYAAAHSIAADLAGEDPADVLGGRKVRSFFVNILRPAEAGAVTVDRPGRS